MHGGVCMVGGMDGKWVCMAGGVWHGDMHGRGCVAWGHAWQGACMAGESATAAGGTHPTGMHSCL